MTAGWGVLRSFRYMMAYDETEGKVSPNNVIFFGILQGLNGEGESLGQTPLSHDEQVIVSGCQAGIA